MCVFAAGAAMTATQAMMANVALAATAASTAMSAYGAYSQGQAQSRQMKAQAQIQENNQKYAEWKAQDALKRASLEEDAYRQKVRGLIGRQTAVQAASGLETAYGSAVETRLDTAAQGELDALTIRNNGEREAWGYRVEAQNLGDQAALSRANASSASSSGKFGAFTSLIGGAGSFASRWYQFDAFSSKTPAGAVT